MALNFIPDSLSELNFFGSVLSILPQTESDVKLVANATVFPMASLIYVNENYDNDLLKQSQLDACCPVRKKKTRTCKPRRKPRCPHRRKPSCARKRKLRCPRRRKPRCPRKRKPSCPRKRKPRCPRKRKPRCPRRKKCSKPGPITNNGYLNFIRMYRRKHCGLKPHDLVQKAARAWCRLPQAKKNRYIRQACKVSTSCRTKRKPICR